MKPTILSGIQPSGKLHLGNYLGALSNFVALQNSQQYMCLFMLADYHSISENYETEKKHLQVLDLAADFLAAGLDPKKSIIFTQSQLPEHTELAWILNCVTPVSELERMTQYKDKSQKQVKNINMGLFDYPVLQAADILLYKTTAVPIGQDQKQHLELTNTIAKKFNHRFGPTFSEVKPIWADFPKIMDLKNPDKKMSKSSPEGCLFLDDEPEEIRKKLKKAQASSFKLKEIFQELGIIETGSLLYKTLQTIEIKNPDFRGGINLLLLLAYFDPDSAQKLSNKLDVNYSDIKDLLAKAIIDKFKDFRTEKKRRLNNPSEIKLILKDGANKAKKIASQTLKEVKQKIGLA